MAAPLIRESTREELLELIDERARFLLGISGVEFMRRYCEGELEEAPVEGPITVLADLVQHSTQPLTPRFDCSSVIFNGRQVASLMPFSGRIGFEVTSA
jgi:hypothetical protein